MPMPYHNIELPKGKYGEFSKVEEEFLELKDAWGKGSPVQSLVEAADLIGAIEGFVETQFKGTVTLADLLKMANDTKDEFKAGRRK